MIDRVAECIILEDNLEYEIVEKIKYNNIEYIFLTNVNNCKDFCIRKLIGDSLYGLEDENEYNFAMKLIREKHSEILEKLGLV